jgi:nicotinate-nucleotide adenylyltransferase
VKIGILGGTFDPVHRGHLQLAQNAQSQFALDKVIFVPACQPPHKQNIPELTSAQDRYEMVRLAIEGEPFLEVSDCELKRGGVSYTFDTLIEFEKIYPGSEFFLILGKDALGGVDTWHRAIELKKKARFLVAMREPRTICAPEGIYAAWIQMHLCPISSSGIRTTIKQGGNVDDYLSLKVLKYIQVNALYGKS